MKRKQNGVSTPTSSIEVGLANCVAWYRSNFMGNVGLDGDERLLGRKHHESGNYL